MQLTGKAKEDFEKWLNKNWEEKFLTGTQRAYEFYTLKWFNEFSLSMQWGVLQDFFDESGYNPYVEVFDDGTYDYTITNLSITSEIDFEDGPFNTMNQAREAAILKACELYNEKHK